MTALISSLSLRQDILTPVHPEASVNRVIVGSFGLAQSIMNPRGHEENSSRVITQSASLKMMGFGGESLTKKGTMRPIYK